MSDSPFGGVRRVLLIEDNVNIARLLQFALEVFGEVETTIISQDFHAAISEALEGPVRYDLCVADWHLGREIAGREVIEMVAPWMPVIVWTGWDPEQVNTPPNVEVVRKDQPPQELVNAILRATAA